MRLRKLPVFLISIWLIFGFTAPAFAQETGENAGDGGEAPSHPSQTLQSPEAPDPRETIGLDPVQAGEAAGQAPVRPHSGGKLNRALPASTVGENFVPIMRQAEDHLLITVGDTVYLPAPGLITLKTQDTFNIYKVVKQTDTGAGPADWLEQVGKLKIVASLDELTIGRVIAARDIIRKGDFVLLRREP